jgi:hypothetical protein
MIKEFFDDIQVGDVIEIASRIRWYDISNLKDFLVLDISSQTNNKSLLVINNRTYISKYTTSLSIKSLCGNESYSFIISYNEKKIIKIELLEDDKWDSAEIYGEKDSRIREFHIIRKDYTTKDAL